MSVDVTDRKELKAWLEKQPREVVLKFASRTALRVLPMLAVMDFSTKTANEIVLSVFRESYVVWKASAFPIDGKGDATKAYFDFSDGLKDKRNLREVVRSSGAASVSEVALAILASNSAYAALAAFGTNSGRVSSAITPSLASGTAFSAFEAAISVFETFTTLNFDVNGNIDVTAPLWQTVDGFAIPVEVENIWQDLKDQLLNLNPNWHVWTDWYEARLYPDKFPAPNKKLELARAMIPKEIWDQGWEVVNPYIEKLIEDHTPRDVGIGPSAYHFYADDGIIRARAVVQSDDLNELCVELYEKTKNSLEQALENESSNRPLADWLKTYIYEMQEALGKSPDDVKSGQLLFVSKDIEADNAVFELERNQGQVAFSDQRLLNKMSGWLDELLPCLEKVRAHEAAKLALAIQQQDAEQINAYADEIIGSASQSSIVDATAINALKSRDEALAKDKKRMASDDERIAEQGIMDYAENVSLKVLENRNFIRRSLDFGKQELKEIGGRSYQGAKDGFVKGIEKSTTAGVVATLSMAVGWLNPIGGMALFIASFRKDEANVKSLIEESKKLDAEQEDVSPED